MRDSSLLCPFDILLEVRWNLARTQICFANKEMCSQGLYVPARPGPSHLRLNFVWATQDWPTSESLIHRDTPTPILDGDEARPRLAPRGSHGDGHRLCRFSVHRCELLTRMHCQCANCRLFIAPSRWFLVESVVETNTISLSARLFRVLPFHGFEPVLSRFGAATSLRPLRRACLFLPSSSSFLCLLLSFLLPFFSIRCAKMRVV